MTSTTPDTTESPSGAEGSARVRPWLSTEADVAKRIILVAVAFVLIVWLVRQVEIVAVAAFIGFAQTALLWPVVKKLRRILPGGLAAILVVTIYAAFIVSLIWFVGVRLANSWDALVDAVLGGLGSANDWLVDKDLSLTPEIVRGIEQQARGMMSQVFSGVGAFALSGISIVSTLGTIVVVATFATLFTLASGDDLWRSVLGAIHPSRRGRVDAAFRDGFRTARWWMFASSATGAVDALFIGLGLWVLGVPFLLPIMVLTFILGFIPMVGATIAGAIAVAVALFSGGVTTAVWALLIVLAVQQIEGNILSPLLLSRAMQFNPVITLLLAASGGLALGFTGLFLAVPLAGIVVALRRGWYAASESDAAAAEIEGEAEAHETRPEEIQPEGTRPEEKQPGGDG